MNPSVPSKKTPPSASSYSRPDVLERIISLQILDVFSDGRLGPLFLVQVFLQPLDHHLVIVPEVALERNKIHRLD